MVTSPPRKKRKVGDARLLVIDAARELFGSRGYDGTSVRDIAQHAQVADSVLFRNFGTKAKLFEESILQPYHGLISDFMGKWRTSEVFVPNEELVRTFVTEFYELLTEHRELVAALLSAKTYTRATGQDAGESELSREIDELYMFALPRLDGRNHGDNDLRIVYRLVVGLVMTTVVFDDWLFPQGPRHPTPEHLINEITKLVVRGVER